MTLERKHTQLPASHGCYGVCPECHNDHTLVKSGTFTRICLTCGFSEDFPNGDQAMVGWKQMPPSEKLRLYCTSTIPQANKNLYPHEGD